MGTDKGNAQGSLKRGEYPSVSPWVDLDVITAGKGIVLAILITEKQPQAD